MKHFFTGDQLFCPNSKINKAFLRMRIFVFLMLFFCAQGYSTGFSQNTISLSVKNQELKTVFALIQQNSSYKILYNDNVVTSQQVSLTVKNASINEVMNKVLLNTNLQFTLLENNLVVISAASAKAFVPIRGKITDESGQPIANVSVMEKNTSNGTVTGEDGSFTLNVKNNQSALVFTHLEYETLEVPVNGKDFINMSLKKKNALLSDVVVVGYGKQKRVNLTGAVSAVTTKDIVTTKNENVQNMLTGKVAGLRIVQNTSEPGSFTNNFDIRGLGTPLIIIDGIPRDNVSQLNPDDIESVSVLKDASAAVYGVRAANGVVLITTKKGKSGTPEITYSGNWGWQKMSGMPKLLNAVDYMTLVNEQNMHNPDNPKLVYTDADFAPYLNGTKKSTDWFGATLKNTAPENQQNLSVTGGIDKTNYFLSLGYTGQDGFFRSNDLNYHRYNVRSNVTTRLTKRLSVDLNVNGIMDQKNQPWQDADWVFRTLWGMLPTDPIYANDNPKYLMKPAPEGDNPIAMTRSDISGYQKFNNYWFQSSAAFHYDIPYVEGLKLNGLFSYDMKFSDNKYYRKMYSEYIYDAAADKYNATTYGGPSQIKNEHYSFPSMLSQISLNYDRKFGDHSVNALVLFEESERSEDNFYAQRDLSLALDQLMAGDASDQLAFVADKNGVYQWNNHGLVGKFNYAYQGKYLAEFSFRYDGSSKFPPGKQWGFFPSGSVGWRISEENFFKNSEALSFINNLKIRASYGKLGDDASANNNVPIISGFKYPADGDNNKMPSGSVFNGNFINAIQSTGVPNPNLTWYTSKTTDIGIDIEAWKGLLGITADIFRRDRSGLLDYRSGSLPDVLGAALPQENLNSDRAQGIDLEINHRNKIGKFEYFVKGIFGYTRTEWRHKDMAPAGNSWENWKNNNDDRYNNIWWGLGADGRFQSYSDIINNPVYYDRYALLGNYEYEDWNGDGQINDLDRHPIAYQQQPLINYGLTIGGSYKGIDVNLLFQGANMSAVSYIEQLRIPLWGGRSALAQFMDRWHPVDPTANPYDPNTKWISGNYAYTGTQPDENSMFNIQNCGYLRLKTVEIGYTLPVKTLSSIGVKNVRVYANGYNLVTFTKLKYMDPEHPSSSWGYLYPLNKVFNVGINLRF